MAIAYHEIADPTTYRNLVYSTLKSSGYEGTVYWAYADSKGIPTIGVGFNLRDESVLREIVKIFGPNPFDVTLTTEQRAREQYWYDSIREAVSQGYPQGSTVRDTLNAVMQLRAQDTIDTVPNKRLTFEFGSEPELRQAFDEIIKIYEQRVNNWLAGSGMTISDSTERIALVSLAYQGWINTGKSPLLRDAIVSNNRAAAWYEIRYNTNSESRRLREADLFGLFNSGTNAGFTDQEAKETLSYLYQQYDVISSKGYANDFLNQITPAKTYLQNTYTEGWWVDRVATDTSGANSLAGSGNRDLIFGESGNDTIKAGAGEDYVYGGEGHDTLYGQQGNDTLYGENGYDHLLGEGDSDDLYGGSGNDLLEGSSGVDHLYGGTDNDILAGGADNDSLFGGTGFDVYLYNTGDGYDRIADDDGHGRLVMNGGIVATESFENGYLQGMRVGTSLVINNSVEILNFTDGVLGIYFDNPQNDPAKNGGYPAGDPNSPNNLDNLGVPSGPYDPTKRDPGFLKRIRDKFDGARGALVSPLVLDLDGDGVETIAVGTGSYFDHDGNGFAQSTGWVGADDGLLIWDRNGDSIVNNGSELFGSETLLANGSKATNGFFALADLDTNLDGVISISDAAWSALQIWQDLDGDGVSSAGELKSLADSGISSLSIASTASTYIDPNGNEHRLTGSFTRTDGTTAQMADVWFKTDPVNSVATEWLKVPADIAALPNLSGYGNVYDLQQAMVRDTSGGLKQLIQSYVSETDADLRAPLLDQIIFKWTGVDTVDPASRGSLMDARRVVALEKFLATSYVGSNGSSNPGCGDAPAILNEAYTRLVELVNAQLAAQTHFKYLYDMISYGWDRATLSVKGDLSAVISYMQGQLAADSVAGRRLVSEFASTLKALQADTSLDTAAFFNTFASIIVSTGTNFDDVIEGQPGENLTYLGFGGNDTFHTYGPDDTINAGGGNDTINDTGGSNVIDGGSGNDWMWIEGSGTNTIRGGDGNDTVQASFGANSVIEGGAGDDYLLVHRTGGSPLTTNSFRGGAGNDQLFGSASTDTYYFDRGDGTDTVNDHDWGAQGATDTIAFGAGITQSDIIVRRGDSNLGVRVNDPNNPAAYDHITIQWWFTDPTHHRIERFTFADGTVLGIPQIHALATVGTALDDTLTGWSGEDLTYTGLAGNDTINPDSGNDTVYGGDGNDTINESGGGTNFIDAGAGDDAVRINVGGANTVYGGDGNDIVQASFDSDTIFDGGAGDDYLLVHRTGGSLLHHNTFIGGLGNDQLFGGASADTFIYNRGDGSDTINDHDYGAQGATDTIVFGPGIAATDLVVRRTGNDLLIRVTDPGNPAATDQIGIQYWFNDPSRARIEQFTFSDGTVLNIPQIHALATVGTALDDSFGGWDGENLTYTGFAGNDTISAYNGNDAIYGGDGNDAITDTGGNNTVDAGTGSDTIAINGPGANTVTAGDGNDNIQIHYDTDNTIDGGAGDDYLLVWRNGGSALHHNTFIGGLGNDYLLGTASTDTYLFNRGDGSDTVNDYDYGAQGATDRISFGAGIVQSDLAVSRSGDHLLIGINDPNNPAASDRITVQWWYADPSHHCIEQFAFADGTTLTGNQVEALIPVPPPPPPNTVYGTEGGDTLNTGTGNDTVYGLGGNDTLRDTGGTNTLDGGDGNDTITTVNNASSTLNGGAGDDFLLVDRDGGSPLTANTFQGGTGNDSLYGSASTDTYLFNRGDGVDWVNDHDYGAQGANDLLSFGTGINPLDLVFSRNGDHLKLSVHNSTDSVNVQWWYADPSHHHVETVRAGNGSTLVDSRVDQLIQAMATFSAQNGGITWDQAIDQRPDDVQAILAANWMPAT